MTEDICGEMHPDDPEITCEKPLPCFRFHVSRTHALDWGECPDPPKRTPGAGRKRLDEMAARASRSHRVNRSECENRIEQPWVDYATQVFHEFLKTRTDNFTTPQDLWPLVESPEDMREMVQVVRRALREEWIKEVAAVRLTGSYRTKDGIEFKMNKLVPVYRSLISGTNPPRGGD